LEPRVLQALKLITRDEALPLTIPSQDTNNNTPPQAPDSTIDTLTPTEASTDVPPIVSPSESSMTGRQAPNGIDTSMGSSCPRLVSPSESSPSERPGQLFFFSKYHESKEIIEQWLSTTSAREHEVKKMIVRAMALNFYTRLPDCRRPSRTPEGKPIELIGRKSPDQKMRLLMVHVATEYGYVESSPAKKKEIATAACCLVAYDNGLLQPPKGTMLDKWVKQLDQAIKNPEEFDLNDVLGNKKMGPKMGTYTERIEQQHPGFLHQMYRLACKEIGADSNWRDLADEMNVQSRKQEFVDADKPALSMSRATIRKWFLKLGGKQKRVVERPIITPLRKIERVKWCTDRKQQVESDEPFYMAFLDEKWFYVRSRRRKMKHLPLGEHEQAGANVLPMVRTASRRFPTKVCHQLIVA